MDRLQFENSREPCNKSRVQSCPFGGLTWDATVAVEGGRGGGVQERLWDAGKHDSSSATGLVA